ncbi:MAG: GNAT family N-acetyltransferase [Brevundimonas sp.]|nr:MAG: GNAT family N-acetyltransferase [Brevundimonas sp.]
MGWGVAPRFQGKGLAFEAAQAAVGWCDTELKALRTCCIISPENGPSLSLAARLGYLTVREADFHGDPIRVLERVAPH